MRKVASAIAARCSALPCPNGWSSSGSRLATPSAKNVSSAATRSVPECIASATRPRLPVSRPVTSLRTTRTAAAKTDSSAVRCCGDILEDRIRETLGAGEQHAPHDAGRDERRRRLLPGSDLLEGPLDHGVLRRRVAHEALERQQRASGGEVGDQEVVQAQAAAVDLAVALERRVELGLAAARQLRA